MHGINYYSLLKDGMEYLRNADWEEVVKSVVYHRRDLEDPDVAVQALCDICVECSQEWVGKRTRIVREAISNHSNPTNQSDYCLNALREMAYEASKEAARHNESPEAVIVRRQVSDHLRALDGKGVLVSHMVRSTAGRDRFKYWGLKQWGPDWVKKKPEKSLEQVKKDLPIILAYREGKGIFDYASILPTYIPNILAAYGAALSTDEISSIICFKISPPLFRNPNTLSSSGSYDPWADESGEGYQTMPSPEDLVVEKQLWKSFSSLLTERELQIFKMSEEGISVDEIASTVGCSARTVINDRKSIFEKCRAALNV